MKMHDLINQCTGYRILVVGDFILDVYHQGTSSRIAPEAPVPVVDIEHQKYCAGGAANVAFNLKALGAEPLFCTITGTDSAAANGRQLFEKNGLCTTFMGTSDERTTLVKERVSAGGQTLIRFDRGTRSPLTPAAESQLIHLIETAYFDCEAIIVSDYAKGLFTPKIITLLEELRAQRPIYLAVDSGSLEGFRRLLPDVVKPNYPEALRLLHQSPTSSKTRRQAMAGAGEELHRCTGAATIALTLDEDGVLLFQNKEMLCGIPAKEVQQPQVSGAGDTFISTYTLMQLAGATLQEAGEVAIAAAGITIEKSGTACCSRKELYGYFARSEKHITSLQQLSDLCRLYHEEGKSIVFTNGCFDILHSGHVNYLNRAAQLGDLMIVGINNDKSIHRLKGKGRPINPLEDRLEVLSALEAIDHLITFGRQEDDTPMALIKAVRPDLYVKGGDYNKDDLPEAKWVEQQGGKVRILSHIPDHSTTQVIRRIQQLNGPIIHR